MNSLPDMVHALETVNPAYFGYGKPSELTMELQALGYIVIDGVERDGEPTGMWSATLTRKGHEWCSLRGGKPLMTLASNAP